LQTYVSRLRRALGDDAIATRQHGYVLSVAPGACDADRFRELVAEGARALADDTPEHAEALMSEALALWRGPVLGGLGMESWARADVDCQMARSSYASDRLVWLVLIPNVAIPRSGPRVGRLHLRTRRPLRS
jgi:hypothetical protein